MVVPFFPHVNQSFKNILVLISVTSKTFSLPNKLSVDSFFPFLIYIATSSYPKPSNWGGSHP